MTPSVREALQRLIRAHRDAPKRPAQLWAHLSEEARERIAKARRDMETARWERRDETQ